MAESSETFKHGGHRVVDHKNETLSTTTHEPPVVDPWWKVKRFVETVYVQGRTVTQAYENAALKTGAVSLAHYFSIVVEATRIHESQVPEVDYREDDHYVLPPYVECKVDFELPPFMD